MQTRIMRRLFMIGMAFWVAASIAGCGGPSVDGKYVNSMSGTSITFSGGKATLDLGMMGKSTSDYTVSGNTVTVKTPVTDTVFTINSDGSITANGATFKKAS
jgi:hypothetical protein